MNEIIADDMYNGQRVVPVRAISGNVATLNEKLAEVVVDTGSGKQRCIAVKQYGGGGGGGTDNYNDLENKPKINNTTLSGNKTGADLGLVDDVQVNGTSVVADGVANIPVASQDTLGVAKVSPTYGLTVSNGIIVGSTKTESVYSTAANSLAVCKGTLDNIKDNFVRSVSPACTTITAADTTATLVANTTYASTVNSAGCVFTIVTPSSSDVYSGFILQLDTTNSASVAFQTDDTPAATISISGNPTIEVGKKYTVTGQWDVLNSSWQLFIISYETT